MSTGSLGGAATTPVHLVAGANTLSFTVTNEGGASMGNPAGLAWKLALNR